MKVKKKKKKKKDRWVFGALVRTIPHGACLFSGRETGEKRRKKRDQEIDRRES